MAFSKSKTPGPTAVQRLNDQRHRIALGAVAAGAAVAAVFRRRRRGGGVEIPAEEMPTSTESAATAVGLNAMAEIPADEPEMVEIDPAAAPAGEEPKADRPAPKPIGGPASTKRPANSAPASAASSAISDPTTGELNAEEASILSVLAQSGRKDDDRTAIAVATSLERDTADVSATLDKLDSEGVVSGEQETPDGDKIWAVTERGVRRLGAQH
jgi:hypothetical protein